MSEPMRPRDVLSRSGPTASTGYPVRPGLAGQVVAVTGGGGFIGSRLLCALQDAGAIVRTLLGPPDAEVNPSPDGVLAVRGDIDDPLVLDPLVARAAVVLHLAGPRSVVASFGDPAAFARVHVAGTAAVVAACARAGVARLIYVSSAEVYGRPERNPVTEECQVAPRSPYAAAKVGGEAFVRAGVAAGHFEAVLVRPFSVYGPGMAADTLLGTVLRQVRSGSLPEVVDSRSVRDYCHVDDIVTGLVASCTASLPQPARAYNLASGVGISAGVLATQVLTAAGRNGTVRIKPDADRPHSADIQVLVGNPGRAAVELGWRAVTPFDVGLSGMLAEVP